MIRESDLSWMKPGGLPADANEDQVSGEAVVDDDVLAARHAIGEARKNLRRSSTNGKDAPVQDIVELLTPRQDQKVAKWAELKANSSTWAPPTVSERNGHPAHSLEAFDAIYEMRDELGNGGFGQVFTAVRRRTLGTGAQLVAVKIIKTGKGCTEKDLEDEAELARKLDHPNIISAIDAYWTTAPRDELRLVEEYASGGELLYVANRLFEPLLPRVECPHSQTALRPSLTNHPLPSCLAACGAVRGPRRSSSERSDAFPLSY